MENLPESKSSSFLSASFGGSNRNAAWGTNETHFEKNGSHDSEYYWCTLDELLIGFSSWYLRCQEKNAYQQFNRVYSACYTYRFFKVEDTYPVTEMYTANDNLSRFEITEEEFISDMFNSHVYKQLKTLVSKDEVLKREARQDLELSVTINREYNTWCWKSDYLADDPKEDTYNIKITVNTDTNTSSVVGDVSKLLRKEFRFGGSDTYNKKKSLGEV